MSADLNTDLTIELVVKNYPKMTPHTSKSLHWIKSYVDFSPKLIKMLLQMWLQTSVGELVQIQPRPRGGRSRQLFPHSAAIDSYPSTVNLNSQPIDIKKRGQSVHPFITFFQNTSQTKIDKYQI